MILQIVANGSERAIGAAGVGILEDLLRRHGTVVIDRIGAEAARDQRFRVCLSHVWLGDMPSGIWERVVAARGEQPQHG